MVKLGDIALPSDKKVEPTEIQSIPYIGLEHIEKDTGNLLGYGNSKDVKSTKSKFYSGDLLYGKLRPYLNKVHVVNFEGVCSTDILVFSKNSYISNEFLKYRFLTKDFVSYASQNVNGVQHPRVNFPTLADFSLALPPLNEQKRIVAKIEELNDRTQKIKEALDSIPQLCDRFRQSVLAAAFRGDLTADWRKQNPDVEPASVLLERIKGSEQIELSKTKYDTYDLADLPDNWTWIHLGELGEVSGGITKNSKRENLPLEFPYLRVANVYADYLELNEIKTIRIREEEYERVVLRNGDLLIVEGNGSIDQIGRVCIWDGSISPCLHQNHLIKVRFNPIEIGHYVLIWLLSNEGRQQIIRVASSTTGLHTTHS